MKKFPMDLSKFKKVHSDANASVLRHADGHEFKIAHAKLKPELKKQIEALPHFAEGGSIDDKEPEPMPQETAEQSELPPMQVEPIDRETVPPIEVEEIPQERAPASAPSLAPETQAATAVPAAPPTATAPNLFGASQSQLAAIEKMKEGELAQARATGALGAATQQQVQSYAQQLNKNQETFNAQNSELAKERQALLDDIAANHVDPRRFIKNMSTGDKIMKAIGLVMGGMGSGLTKGPNLAAQFLENQIEQDINAQKLELGKKENLLAHNLKLTQDLRSAVDMTRLHLNDVLSAHLKAEAAKAQNAQTAGLLQSIAGKYDLQSAQLQHNIALQRMMLGGGGTAGTEAQNQEQDFRKQMQFLRMTGQHDVAKDMEAKHIPGVGTASVDVPHDARKEIIMRQDLQEKLAELDAFAAKHSGSLDPAIIAQGKAKAALVQDAVRIAKAAGVFKESEQEFFNTFLKPDPTAFFANYRTRPGYQEAAKDNLLSLNSLKSGYGLPTQEVPQYKTVRGVRYMRGPRGEAIRVD